MHGLKHPTRSVFFDPVTGTYTHVVYDESGSHAAVIDPVLDFDPKSGRISHLRADEVIAFVQKAPTAGGLDLKPMRMPTTFRPRPYIQQALADVLPLARPFNRCNRCSKVCSTSNLNSPPTGRSSTTSSTMAKPFPLAA